MKIFRNIFPIAVMATLVFVNCSPEEYDALPDSGNVTSSLIGNWTLRSVIQKDEGAEIKNSPFVTTDLTSIFPYTQYKLTLDGASGASGTYTAVPGASPKIIRSNTGKWEVDDVKNPKTISFINGTDTTKMQIGSYPRSFNSSFKLRQTKVDLATKKVALTYDYEFVKQ
ncbi:DUF5004 domain-containing protein [Chitinophagaceae bacterium LB-8]|uniref:DUF5004 domain-containing protein n=1 Tax=Paraflavisolibacter caeni TaxID=2982496 RepID=A0A9X3BJB8_9BACT|nr:DUF5004 domain-containing protein [Paraflavisolibacter caeni]MCU7552592.1 DUF5004 domain-containing protein [Paraflavisolibacter caeni]